jgi:hypothetical protein
MKFHSTASNYLGSFPSASLRPVENAGSESWQEDSSTVSSLDLGSECISDAQKYYEKYALRYVDDVLALSTSPDLIKKSIQERFKLKGNKYGATYVLFGSTIIEND